MLRLRSRLFPAGYISIHSSAVGNYKSQPGRRRGFADGRKTADSPAECTVRDSNSFRRAIWSGPYDECREPVCEWRGKMRVSFPDRYLPVILCQRRAGVSRVAFLWKRYSMFLPRGWPRFCGLASRFDKLRKSNEKCWLLINLDRVGVNSFSTNSVSTKYRINKSQANLISCCQISNNEVWNGCSRITRHIRHERRVSRDKGDRLCLECRSEICERNYLIWRRDIFWKISSLTVVTVINN